MTKQKAEKILKQVQNDKNVETGRSMTEMLGVLAIIGVLSIGGIAGYTYAMERHYTNEILNAASQRAIVIASQIAAGRQVSLTEFDGQKEVAGGTFDSTVEEWVDGFGIKVTGVKESVCQKLLKATEGTDVILAKPDGSDFAEADCAGGSFLITYSNDLGKGGEGGGTGANCWVTNTCTSADAEEGEEICHVDGKLHHPDMCSCLEWLLENPENSCDEGMGADYERCRKAGNTSTYCYCFIERGREAETCEYYDVCMKTDTKGCCDCMVMDEYSREMCEAMEQCPHSSDVVWKKGTCANEYLTYVQTPAGNVCVHNRLDVEDECSKAYPDQGIPADSMYSAIVKDNGENYFSCYEYE
jgi:hypothetical protein